MVGFLRKKKSDKTLLTGETALDRKGKVDGASLLDGDGEPTEGTLYDMNGRRLPPNGRNADEENRPNNAGYPPVMATGMYPPQQQGVYGYGQQQQQQYGQQQIQYGQQQSQYGQQQPQYGQQQAQYGQQSQYPPTTLGGQYQYPVRYGQMPPPMPTAAPKRSRFRIPGYGRKN